MPKRVKHYMATVYYTSTGSSSTGKYSFTEDHATEAGTVLYSDGLSIDAAKKLCAKWTARGQGPSLRYSYALCVEDLLE